MAFDWETFVSTGVNPALGWLKDYMGYNLQSNLSRQDYLQDMSKIKTEYGERRRGSKFEYDFAMSRDKNLQQFETDITKLKDSIQRGQIDYSARSELDLTKAKSDVFIGQTQTEEDIRTKEQLKRYKGYADSLKGLYAQDPATKEGVGIKTLTDMGEALNKMSEHQLTAAQKIGELAVEKAKWEGMLKIAKPDEAKEYQQKLAENQILSKVYHGNLSRIQQFQGVIDKTMKGLYSTGITENGEIPEEKKRLYMDALVFLENRYREKGLSITPLPTQRLAEAIQVLHTDIEITPDDLKFIDAQRTWLIDWMNKQSKKK